MSAAELKPCPCCGGKPRFERVSGFGAAGGRYHREQVFCKRCGLRTREFTKPGLAFEKWNRRTPDATLEAEAAALRAERDELRKALERIARAPLIDHSNPENSAQNIARATLAKEGQGHE